MDVESDYSTYLLREAKSPSAAFHEFRIVYDQLRNDVHVFYEGDDDRLFYSPYVRGRLGQRVLHAYVCDGKSAVIEARRQMLAAGYSPEHCLFFVDRDYDDLFGTQVPLHDEIFLTEGYSVENYVVTAESVRLLLSDFAGFTERDPEHSEILRNFEIWCNRRGEALALFIAWALALRDSGTNPVFANVRIGNVLAVSANGAVQKKRDGFRHF
jgi:hypothetical protein